MTTRTLLHTYTIEVSLFSGLVDSDDAYKNPNAKYSKYETLKLDHKIISRVQSDV